MKINVYTIEFNFPRWLKRGLVYGVLPAALLLGVGAVVRAATVPTLVSFTNGDTLSAANINSNFSNLRDTINTLTIAPTQITAGALPANVTVANAAAATTATSATNCTSCTSATSAASCTTCSAASGTLATQISALQAKTTSLSLKVATASHLCKCRRPPGRRRLQKWHELGYSALGELHGRRRKLYLLLFILQRFHGDSNRDRFRLLLDR
jgi:hypothetical protein